MDLDTFYIFIFDSRTARALFIGVLVGLGLTFTLIFAEYRIPGLNFINRTGSPLGRRLLRIRSWAQLMRCIRRCLVAAVLLGLAAALILSLETETLSAGNAAAVYSIVVLALLVTASCFFLPPQINDTLDRIRGERSEQLPVTPLSEQVFALRKFEGRGSVPLLYPLLYQSMLARLQNLRLGREIPFRIRDVFVDVIQVAAIALLFLALFGKSATMIEETVQSRNTEEPLPVRRNPPAPEMPPEAFLAGADKDNPEEGKKGQQKELKPVEQKSPPAEPTQVASASGISDTPETEIKEQRQLDQLRKPQKQEPPQEISANNSGASPQNQKSQPKLKEASQTSEQRPGRDGQNQRQQNSENVPKPDGIPDQDPNKSPESAEVPKTPTQTPQVAEAPSTAPAPTPKQTAEAPVSPPQPGDAPTTPPQPTPGRDLREQQKATQENQQNQPRSERPPGALENPGNGARGELKQVAQKQNGKPAPQPGQTQTGKPNEANQQENNSQTQGSSHVPSPPSRRTVHTDWNVDYEDLKLRDPLDNRQGQAQPDPDDADLTRLAQPKHRRPSPSTRHKRIDLEPKRYVEPLPLSPQRIPPQYRSAFRKLFKRDE